MGLISTSRRIPPRIRVDGELRPFENLPALGAANTKQLCYSILTDAQKHRFEESLELSFSFGIKNIARFPGNLFNQRGSVAGVFNDQAKMVLQQSRRTHKN